MPFDQKLFGLIYFITGAILTYFTYDFFFNLITGMSTSGYDGWAFIQAILWVSYGVTIINWLLLIPILTIIRDTAVHPMTMLKTIGYFIFGIGLIYISYPLVQTLISVLDGLITSPDWDGFTLIFWVAYIGIILLVMIGAPLYCVFKEPEAGY